MVATAENRKKRDEEKDSPEILRESWIPGRHAPCFRRVMANSFRDMVTWQLAFELKEKVIALIARSPGAKRDFDFRDQLTDACKSVPSNIAEGYGRYRPAEIARFLEFAAGSLDETENHLRDGVGSGYFSAEDVGPLIRLGARCRTAMNRWQAYLQRAKHDPRFTSQSRQRNKTPRERTVVKNPRRS